MTVQSTQIYSSRDNTRNQIISYLQDYLELENVDLTKSSFLSYLINIFSTLTSNLMFFSSSAYQEQFMTLAQLPESVYNLSAFLGYNAQIANATPADVSVLFTIPLTFTSSYGDGHISFTIPENHKFYAGDVIFIPTYSTTVTIYNNATASIEATKDNKKYSLPFTMDTTSANSLYFVLPLEQKEPRTSSEGNSFQYTIPNDLETYQFITLDVPFTEGELTDIEVYVTNPGEPKTRYTRYSSIYLMDSESDGYVLQIISSGYRIIFGNGLMGTQPRAGAIVDIEGYKTYGSNGNIIAGSLSSMDTVLVDDGSTTEKVLAYTITNPSPASGGDDSEDIEEVRSRAIAGITTLNRLVTSDDYSKFDEIAPTTPITDPIAILKRSDLKVNEIQLYTRIDFNDALVPTKNAIHTVAAGVTEIPAGTTIPITTLDPDTNTYVTNYYRNLFDITIDRTINNIAYYEYVVDDVTTTPVIDTTYDISPLSSDLICTSARFVRTGYSIDVLAPYSTEEALTGITAVLVNRNTGATYNMTLDAPNERFTYTFSSYLQLQDSPIQFYIQFYKNGNLFVRYTTTVTIRQDLDYMMMSNISTDSTSTIVYDIPAVSRVWYNNLTTTQQSQFESIVLQSLVGDLDLTNYRMLTDFTNIKFTNTTGYMFNMLLNRTSQAQVLDIGLTAIPVSPSVGDRYIVTGNEGGEWENHPGEIAECTDATAVTWAYTTPTTNDVVYIVSKDTRYVYSEFGWIKPTYSIPLIISLDVFKTRDYTGTAAELISAIKTQLLADFTSRFGSNVDIYRSEIIESVMGVTGVSYCRLLRPKSDIFFNFETTDLTQAQLLRYSPEYVYFTSSSINVNVVGATS